MGILYRYSPTAQALIDAAKARGVTLTLVYTNLAYVAGQPQDRFDVNFNTITWDPFVWVRGHNSDQSVYELAPIMLLAHELVHAGHGDDPTYQGADSEALVMQIANQIALEVNANAPSAFPDYNTNRDNHVRDTQHYSTDSASTSFTITRPGCS